MNLVGITGFKRAGKDTAADFLVENYGYHKYSLADPLKDAAMVLLNKSYNETRGIDYDREQVMPEWGFSMRHFLAVLGTEGLRDLFRQDFHIVRAQMETQNHNKVVIPDVRYENEADFVRDNGGTMLHIIRPGFGSSSHRSEQGIEFKPESGDVRVVNDQTIGVLVHHVQRELGL